VAAEDEEKGLSGGGRLARVRERGPAQFGGAGRGGKSLSRRRYVVFCCLGGGKRSIGNMRN